MRLIARNAVPVAIAGGGIGGLACAPLTRHGFRSVVLEQACEFGEVGVGLHVAPNALTVLDAGIALRRAALCQVIAMLRLETKRAPRPICQHDPGIALGTVIDQQAPVDFR
jgi:salicylate hydroxylase